jgi:molybdopterin converting factor small subunit
MLLHLRSNIFLPGLEGRESIEFNRPAPSLRALLEELAAMAGQGKVDYVRPGAPEVSDDWEVLVNDLDLHGFGGLDAPLAEGDTITINMLVIGGG